MPGLVISRLPLGKIEWLACAFRAQLSGQDQDCDAGNNGNGDGRQALWIASRRNAWCRIILYSYAPQLAAVGKFIIVLRK
jgi:hypothetical protein